MERPLLRFDHRMRYLIYAAFFFSGASGLIFQVIWLRMLKLIFGTTTLAVSTVLSAFMAGLALGSFVFGRLADRRSNRIRIYALLELGVGLSALLLPALSKALIPLYAFLYRWQVASGSFYLSMLIYFAICFAFLLIPTTLMGGTLPVLCSYSIETRSTLGKRVGMLYGLNTLGAMAGCFAAGFLLLWLVGERSTLSIAAGFNIAIGLLFLACSARTARNETPPASDEPRSIAAVAGQEPQNASRWIVGFVLLVFGLSGMAALGYEVAWTRILVYFVSLDTYAFSAMLTVFLMGLALGSFAYTRFWDTRTGLIRRFALMEIGIGATAIGSLFLFSQLRHLNAVLLAWEDLRTSWLGLITLKFLDTLVAIFIPTLLMGATFPMVSKIATSLQHKGRSIGDIYAINTVGAIVGAFVAGFVLIPSIGVQPTVVFLGGVNLLIGLGLWIASADTRQPLRLLGGILVTGAWLTAGAVTARTPLVKWTEGFYDEDLGYKLLYAKDGVAASLSILEREDGIREVNLDGKSTAFTNYSDIQVHQYLGHLPLLLFPSRQPAKVLVIGFGLGSTSWSCLQHEVESVECVELVQEERETATYFGEFNRDVLSHPRFKWIVGDGRNHLLAADQQYDVISVNAIHPRFSPSLYTCDFYKLVQSRLADNGIVCAWITLHGLTSQDFKMLLRSFVEVFPAATLWDVNSQHLVMIAGKKPLKIDYALWCERLAKEEIRSHLREVHLEHPHAILSHFMLEAQSMRAFIGDVPLNSDDHPYVEFAHGISASPKAEIFNELMSRKSHILPLLTNLPAAEGARLQLYDDIARYSYAMEYGMPGRFFYSVSHDRQQGEQLMEKALALWPDNEGFAHVLSKCSHVVNSARAQPFQQWWAKGWISEREGKWAEAAAAYMQSTVENRAFPGAYKSLAFALVHLGKYAEAVQALEQLMKLEDRPEYAQWHLVLLVQREFARQVKDIASVTFAGKTIAFDRRDPRTDLFLAKGYSEVGLPDLADAILRQAIKDHPQEVQLYEATGLNSLAWGRFRDAERYFEHALKLDPQRRYTALQLELLRKHVGEQIHPEPRAREPVGSEL